MNHICTIHPKQPILFICLQPKCKQNRLSCIFCADATHIKHDFISISQFQKQMDEKIQVNRNNPEKTIIIKQLNKTKDQILQRLQTLKNKLIGLIGQCQDRVEQYYSTLYHSFAVDSHQTLINRLNKKFDSQFISSMIERMKEFENITMGSFKETQSLLYVNLGLFKQKISQTTHSCTATLQNLTTSFNQFSIAKPSQFKMQFSKQKRQQTYFSLSDSLTTVFRTLGNGGYPLCLMASPFNPINNRVSFLIQKIENNNKRSICLGACLENVVKANNYANCSGFGKGIYAIDQNNPYNSEQNMVASWNHHDTTFNQTNVGNSNLVGWSFAQGDKIRVEIDYYNQIVMFIKGEQQNWQESEEVQVYEMPIKLDAGPIYAFVCGQSKGDKISIVV